MSVASCLQASGYKSNRDGSAGRIMVGRVGEAGPFRLWEQRKKKRRKENTRTEVSMVANHNHTCFSTSSLPAPVLHKTLEIKIIVLIKQFISLFLLCCAKSGPKTDLWIPGCFWRKKMVIDLREPKP